MFSPLVRYRVWFPRESREGKKKFVLGTMFRVKIHVLNSIKNAERIYWLHLEKVMVHRQNTAFSCQGCKMTTIFRAYTCSCFFCSVANQSSSKIVEDAGCSFFMLNRMMNYFIYFESFYLFCCFLVCISNRDLSEECRKTHQWPWSSCLGTHRLR